MISTFAARLRRPRFGIVFLSAVLSLLVSLHWAPMAVPSLAAIVLCAARPDLAVRPVAWWALAGCWLAALVVAPERMEDHVPLFAIWLTALALSLRHTDDDAFLSHAALQARLLIGVTFTAAVAWKLWFGTYLDGVTLWMFMVADNRFAPLATVVGLSSEDLATARADLSDVLDGDAASTAFQASGWTEWTIVLVAVMTLVLEAVIALSHLAPDSTHVARLRLPSIVVFGVVTYGTVPVVPFAVLLALLTMTIARWRPQAMWVLPAFMVVIATRVVLLSV